MRSLSRLGLASVLALSAGAASAQPVKVLLAASDDGNLYVLQFDDLSQTLAIVPNVGGVICDIDVLPDGRVVTLEGDTSAGGQIIVREAVTPLCQEAQVDTAITITQKINEIAALGDNSFVMAADNGDIVRMDSRDPSPDFPGLYPTSIPIAGFTAGNTGGESASRMRTGALGGNAYTWYSDNPGADQAAFVSFTWNSDGSMNTFNGVTFENDNVKAGSDRFADVITFIGSPPATGGANLVFAGDDFVVGKGINGGFTGFSDLYGPAVAELEKTTGSANEFALLTTDGRLGILNAGNITGTPIVDRFNIPRVEDMVSDLDEGLIIVATKDGFVVFEDFSLTQPRETDGNEDSYTPVNSLPGVVKVMAIANLELQTDPSGGAAPCIPDLDPPGGDGVLGFFDLVAYLTLFAEMDPVADLDPPGGDGVFGFFDLVAYLTLFAAGCP